MTKVGYAVVAAGTGLWRYKSWVLSDFSRGYWQCDHSGIVGAVEVAGEAACIQVVNLFKVLSTTADAGLVVQSDEKCALRSCSWGWWCIWFLPPVYPVGFWVGFFALA